MAIVPSVLKTRTLTAIVFLAVMLCGLLVNAYSFALLFFIIHFGCWWEYFLLLEKIANTAIAKAYKYIVVLLSLLCFIPLLQEGGFFESNRLGVQIFYILLGMLIGGLLLLAKNVNRFVLIATLLGFIYISLPIWLLLYFYGTVTEVNFLSAKLSFTKAELPLLVFASLWVNDTAAYLIGSWVGKRPLSSISPKKTWEGTIGGVLLTSMLLAIFAPMVFKVEEDGLQAGCFFLLFGLVVSTAGTFGDLLESKLKRNAGVKDSGSILPGHGGFLDRFDSLLLAVPFVGLLCLVLKLLFS